MFRIATVMAAVLLPVFGLLYHATHQDPVDPMWIRWVLAAAMAAVFVASYRSLWVQRHAEHLLAASAFGITLWFAGLALANDLSPDYALGFFFIVVVAALMSSLSFRRLELLAGYIGFAILTGTVVVALAPATASDRVLLLLCVTSACVGLFFVLAASLQVMSLLDHQRGRLAEAQHIAGLGSWEWDVRTGQLQWSDGLFRICGLPVVEGAPSPSSLLRLVHPEDRPELVRALRSEQSYTLPAVHICRPDGEMRVLRIASRPEHDAGSAPTRYLGTVLDVTEEAEREAALIRARDQAEQARKAAEELARLKSNFLANMSHEIRTPLTAIIGFSAMLVSELEGENREYVDLIEQSGQRLLATLNSVLDLARLQAGQLEFEFQHADAAEVARNVVLALRRQVEEKQITIRLSAPTSGVPLRTDVSALDRVLTNLISNAIKFTEVGSVDVSVRPDLDGARITVRDTGIGISADFLPCLFDEFRQESEGVARSHEGNGLGLAITHKIVELLGGTIGVESVPGEGSTFEVWLPSHDATGSPAAGEVVPYSVRELT